MGKMNKFHGRVVFDEATACEWPDCNETADFQAPGPASNRNRKLNFCLEHIREYNQNYDYFQGLSANEIVQAQAEKYTWARETWPVNKAAPPNHPSWQDLHDLSELREFSARHANDESPLSRPLTRADKNALKTLGLNTSTSAAEIKRRYKQLVKKHHPDSHSGDAKSPKMLHSVMEAYNQLASGLKK